MYLFPHVSVSVDIDGDYLASAGWGSSVKVWNMKLRKQLYEVKHDGRVECVKVHGELVISASLDHTIKLSNRSDGHLLHTLRHDDLCLNFDISNNLLAVAARDGLYIWSLRDQQRIKKIDFYRVVDVRFQGRSIIAARENGEVYAIKME